MLNSSLIVHNLSKPICMFLECRVRYNRCLGNRGNEIFGRAPRFLDLGARLAASENVIFKPCICLGTEILDRAPIFLDLGARLATSENG